ncbi:FAD binding domain-containing protein [Defluviimonas sp. SAOS-178_SWC]|uniref:FAD binding domain-containing protein n=1 Tax=Defluviimonas sp. SAOS-178_SWC TaxID=3121287 RepID=UPI003221A22E
MRPASFEYHRAEDLCHALDLLHEFGDDASPLAGGQSLVPMMNLRLARPEILVDINNVGCAGIEVAERAITLGGLCRHHLVMSSDDIHRRAPILREAYGYLAHPVIRRRGTAGGSIAYADPTAELPTLLMLLDGEITLSSKDSERQLHAAEFFRGAFSTAAEPTELVTALRLNLPAGGWGGAFDEVSQRHGDYAVASVAVAVRLKDDRLTGCRIAVSGADTFSVRATALEDMLNGETPSDALARAAGQQVQGAFACYSDIRASAENRRRILARLVETTLVTAFARAGEGRS